MPRKTSTLIIIALIILVLLAFGLFWYFFMYSKNSSTGTTNNPTSGFSPFGQTGGHQQGTSGSNTNNPNTTYPTEVVIPALRQLSATPIGGYGASTTASTTIVRWIDRGRGNILEAREDSLTINTLSNTLLPKTYESVWNKSISSFIAPRLLWLQHPHTHPTLSIPFNLPQALKPLQAPSHHHTSLTTPHTPSTTPQASPHPYSPLYAE